MLISTQEISEVLTVIKMTMLFFWVATPCRLVRRLNTNVSEKILSPSSGLKMFWVVTPCRLVG
jgi:hypothetical protein